MRNRWHLAAPMLASLMLLSGPVAAQFGTAPVNPFPEDSRGNRGFQIKRKTVQGSVKSTDGEKKLLVLNVGDEKEPKELRVVVGPCRIFAGPGSATLADFKPGDKLKVYGETTVHGNLRAMDIWAPKERMSIAPPEKPKKIKLTPEQKKAKREAAKAKRAADEAKRKEEEAAAKAKRAEEKAAIKARKEAQEAARKARKAKAAEEKAAEEKAAEEKAEEEKSEQQ